MSKSNDRMVTLDDKPSNQAVTSGDSPVAAMAEAVIKGKNHDEALSGKRVSVTFYEQDSDMGKMPVQVGLNGIAYQIPRGVPCSIPVEVLGVVKDAVEEVYEANGTSVTKRVRPRFSYQIHA